MGRPGASVTSVVSAVVAAALAVVLAGCGWWPRTTIGEAEPQVPQPCGQVFNRVRCLAMTDSVANQLTTTREDIVSLVVLPPPTPEVRDGQVILRMHSGGQSVELLVTLADGSVHPATIFCVGIPDDPGCFDDPHLTATSVTHGGYHDTPEGASPVPSAAPDALAEATELRIDQLDITIDHVGRHEVRLGEARLPNGLLTTADFQLVDDWPSDVTILDRAVGLEVRSLSDGEPIWNIYEHGWREGTERVEAVLVFNVFRFEPGAKLSIQDVVVR
jgi:hypothetical protein